MDSLKETLYSTEVIDQLADNICDAYPDFNKQTFCEEVFSHEWDSLELKQRMWHVTRKLHDFLPKDYSEAIKILMTASENTRGFVALSFSDFAERYGQSQWDLSMEALACFTKSCSSEFAIRPFLDVDPKLGMKQMLQWATDKNEHIRRLSTEGCRPRLPWAIALKKFIADPSPILPILEILKNDPSDYVRKSVANNLNDISKNHPEIVLDICKKWKGSSKNTDKIIKHACRTLLKSGNKKAMILFGFGDPENIKISAFKPGNNRLKIGEQTQLQFELHINEEKKKKIRLEYLVHFIKSSGKSSQKVFQISEKEWMPGKHTIRFKHNFLDRSTRKHYPGTHRFEIVVNGEKKSKANIELTS